MTRTAGVAGRPIGHSLSPLIHGAWIAGAGLDARYEAFDGLAMLIGQARPSFEAFFGVAPPTVEVRRLALEAIA